MFVRLASKGLRAEFAKPTGLAKFFVQLAQQLMLKTLPTIVENLLKMLKTMLKVDCSVLKTLQKSLCKMTKKFFKKTVDKLH